MILRGIPHRRAGIVLMAILAIAGTASAQVISLYSSRPVAVGARAEGLANAYVGDAYDATALYWNPAALAFLETSSLVLDHSQEKTINSMNENLAIPFRIRKGEAFALGLTVNHVGYVGKTRDGAFRAMQYGYDAAYAYEFIPTLSLGVGVGVRYAQSGGSNVWGVSSSAGIFYSPSPEVSYGASLQGVGSGILYASDGSTTSLSSENLPRVLSAGAELRYPSEFAEPMLTVSVANEKIFGRSGIRYMGGAEVFVLPFLALRGGYIVDPDYGTARFGLGIKTNRIRLDYAISPSGFTDQVYHLSLAITLWSPDEQY